MTKYNLLVSASTNDFEGDPFRVSADRFISSTEYTDESVVALFDGDTAKTLEEVSKYPCIFAYEIGCEKDPKFGWIESYSCAGNTISVSYRIIPLERFITTEDLSSNLNLDLSTSKSEMYRTHWALKDVDLFRALRVNNIFLPTERKVSRGPVNIEKHEFDVAFSFPGEEREFVRNVANSLKPLLATRTSLFFDEDFQGELARPSLDDLLQNIYRDRSKLVVCFVCAEYESKDWCGIEYRAIKEIVKARHFSRIMYISLGDGNVPGLLSTDGQVQAKFHSPPDLAQMIRNRLTVVEEEQENET